MNKNILLGVIALVVLSSAVLVVMKLQNPPSSPAKIDVASLEKNISDLNAIGSDEALVEQDEAINSEIDSALNDIGEITIEGSSATSLNNDEASLNSLSNDLTDIAADEAALSELDQALGDAAAN